MTLTSWDANLVLPKFDMRLSKNKYAAVENEYNQESCDGQNELKDDQLMHVEGNNAPASGTTIYGLLLLLFFSLL